jgi:hypothetical protein
MGRKQGGVGEAPPLCILGKSKAGPLCLHTGSGSEGCDEKWASGRVGDMGLVLTLKNSQLIPRLRDVIFAG